MDGCGGMTGHDGGQIEQPAMDCFSDGDTDKPRLATVAVVAFATPVQFQVAVAPSLPKVVVLRAQVPLRPPSLARLQLSLT